MSQLATTSTDLGVTSIHACAQKGQICEVRKTDPIAFAIKVNEEKTYKFYVLNDDGNTITLIMNKNLYEDGNTTESDVAWINPADYTTENNKDETPDTCGLKSCNDEGPITAINILNKRTYDWYYITAKPYTYNGMKTDGIARKYEDITMTMTARMITYAEATTLGCTTSSGSCPSWLYENLNGTGDDNTWGYWTSTVSSTTTEAWNLGFTGRMNPTYVFGNYGVRPVIELSK